MVDGILSPVGARRDFRRPAKRLIVRYRLTPWWLQVLVVWALSRVVSTTLILIFARWQEANAWTGESPGYFAFAQLWDGTWYHIVATSGYPSALAVTAGGQVGESAWAFLPAYPMLVRLFLVTGLPWEFVSVVVSLAFSLGSALLFYRLMRRVQQPGTALFSVVLFCVAPLSPIMQVSYAESMGVFFLVLALYLLLQRRYALLFPVVAMMALTRPTGLAFALALGLHVLHRLLTRERDPFPFADRVVAIGATGFSILMGFAWSLIAWAVTGVPGAYTDTELAWRAPYVGNQAQLMPFAGWVQAAGFWADQWGIAGFGIPLLVLLVALFVVLLFIPPVRRLGIDLRIWMASYAVYLLAVFFPQSSTFRLLVPFFPALGALAQPPSRPYRVAIVALLIAGQFGWLYICWWSNGYDWTPP